MSRPAGDGAPAVERLSSPHVRRLLAGKDVVVLATLQPDGAPLATPMWFLLEEDALVMVSVDDTQKVRNIRRDERVCVVAEGGLRGEGIHGVSVRGRAEVVRDPAERHRLVDRLLDKYQPQLERIWGGRAMPPDRVLFRIVPSRVRSWGLHAG